MKNLLQLLFIFWICNFKMLYSDISSYSTTDHLPGRIGSCGIKFVQFGSTDIFFYMSPEKYALTKKIVEDVNQEKIKLTVDINNYDCLTTEISGIASKYPDPIDYKEGIPIFADPIGHDTLEFYAKALSRLIETQLGLTMEGISREINFVVSQDGHKFHQDQSATQFSFLNKRNPNLPSCKIVQDLTLVDWDMSADTFSATIVQDSLSNERFLITLLPKETVGMLFTQSPIYLTREAHPSYNVPTIFPYHAVLSPIDRIGEKTPGSSKGKRLSTVLRGVVQETQLEKLKQSSVSLPINRPVPFEDSLGKGLTYPNGIIAREISHEIEVLRSSLNLEESWLYKHADKENVEILEVDSSNISSLIEAIAKQFGISSKTIRNTKFFRLIKKDSGFSSFDKMKLDVQDNCEIIILNASEIPENYDYFNLAEDCLQEMLPWIQLYHFPPQKAFLLPVHIYPKLSLTPIEEILFRKAKIDSMRTDGVSSSKKIVTKIDLIILEKHI